MLLLALLRFVADEYTLVLPTDMLVFALFAASLHLLMGPGGMASFGHAAYFGLGAYAAALAVARRCRWQAALFARAAGGGGAGVARSAGSACACPASISPC